MRIAISYIFFLLFVTVADVAKSQQQGQVTDSLLRVLETEKNDTQKVKLLNRLSQEYKNSDPEKAMKNAILALNISEMSHYIQGKISAVLNVAQIHKVQGNYSEATKYFFNALKLADQENDKGSLSSAITGIGSIYLAQKKFNDASDYYLKALKLKEELNDESGIIAIYNNLGIVYDELKQYDKSIDYYLKSLAISENGNNQTAVANSYNNISAAYFSKGNLQMTVYYLKKALTVFENLGDKYGMCMTNINIGIIDAQQGRYDLAINSQMKALGIAKTVNNKQGLLEAYFYLSETYEKKQELANALKYYKLYMEMNDTIFTETSTKQLVEMQTKYETEKKEKEITLLNKDKELQKAQLNKQQIIIWSIAVGLFLTGISAFASYRSFVQKKKANILLEAKNKMIEKQRNDILASINYASRIQQSILIPEEEILMHLPGCFIFFRPRDKVSGDFYWFSKHNNKVILAAVDCTGHGVPGALMSMIASIHLSEIIIDRQILQPANILHQLHNAVFKSLQQHKEDERAQDGMDMALCTIDFERQTVEFAGALNPIYIIQNNQLNVIKGDMYSVGGIGKGKLKNVERTFTNHTVSIENGMSFYLFSDGYIDQFGSPARKKFGSTQFKDLLLKNYDKNASEQKMIISNEMNQWQGVHKQIDDMLVIGMKF